jgi:hypothetical protein
MVMLAVTGTLQDGFSMRRNLNWTSPTTGETVDAVFVGWGLCRGLKAYLDVKEPGSREYDNPHVDGVPYINPACVATGNPLHANVYAVFLVHRDAAFHSLCNLPRYLAMSSDMVRIDLDAEQTSAAVRELLAVHALREGKQNTRSVAVLAVVATFKGPTFVPSPVVHRNEDGTVGTTRNAVLIICRPLTESTGPKTISFCWQEVTNFHDSLAKWAGTSDSLRGTAAWRDAVTKRIRAEQEHFFQKYRATEELSDASPPVGGHGLVFGTDSSTARASVLTADLVARSVL